jgi:ring-1,2-phenylacetyl-CoA epoxidase subunit PaaE
VQSIIFKEEIDALKNRYMNRFQVIHVLSKERLESDLNYGRIDANKCEQTFTQFIDAEKMNEFFLCGPEEMINCIKEYLLSKHVKSENIHFELFNSTSSADKRQAYQVAHQADQGKVCNLTIKVDDRSFDILLPFDGDTILDAALKHGADLPFACKGGVCCTCKAKWK